jgi:hypothetical protein
MPTKPKTASAERSVFVFSDSMFPDQAAEKAKDQGCRLATAVECLASTFLTERKEKWLLVDWTGAPAPGWYSINKTEKKLEPIAQGRYNELAWHEKVYVHRSVTDGVKERRPMAIYVLNPNIDDIAFTDGLYLTGDYNKSGFFEAAFVKIEANNKSALRKE